MSTLSWAIYLSSFGFAGFAFCAFVVLVASMFSWGFYASIENQSRSYDNKLPELIFGWFQKLCVVLMVLFISLHSVKPDRTTVWTIAAIEYGEDVQALKRVETLLDTYMPVNKKEN